MKTKHDWGSNAGKGLSHTRNRGSAIKTTSTCTPRGDYRSVPLLRTPARFRWEQSLTQPPGEVTWQDLANCIASVPGGSPSGGAAPWQQVYPGGASLRPQPSPCCLWPRVSSFTVRGRRPNTSVSHEMQTPVPGDPRRMFTPVISVTVKNKQNCRQPRFPLQ